MRRQEMAVSNKNRIPFAGLAASRIERANIMCLVLSVAKEPVGVRL
jgi:hypothetical protein